MVSTTQPGRDAHWKALRRPGRAKATRSLPSAALANATSCPAEVLPGEIISLGLSPSRTRIHTHVHVASDRRPQYPHHTFVNLGNTTK